MSLSTLNSEAVGDLVLVIQRRRSAGEDSADIEAALMVALQPALRRVAQRFSESARGSLSLDDLVQVGAIEALKFISRYDAAQGGDFEQHVYRRAMRACVDQIRLHAHDVHASAGAQAPSRRARLRDPGEAVVVEVGVVDERQAGDTPEDALLQSERVVALRRAVNHLPLPYRDIVSWFHEIGRPKRTVRQLALERNEPVSRTFSLLKEGQQRLRALLEREGV